MFYSVQVLSKGGPLQVIWLAAHMDKDLKRQQIDSTSISDAVDTIILPPGASTSASQNNEAPLALRLSGQLLLGLVKIFDRKVTYLKHDCDEALQKMAPSTKEETEGEDRGRHVAQQATHQTKRVRKAATSQPPGHREEGMGEGSNERNNNNGTDGALAQHFAVEEDEIFGGASKTDPSPDSLKATAGASTSARLASTMLVAPHVPGSAAEIAGAPSRPSLNPGRALRDADDEMFEAAPEQFDFDLHESEIQELARSKGQVPLPEMDAGNLHQPNAADDDDDDDMGGAGYGGDDADDEADPYAHPDDGPGSSGRPDQEMDGDVAALIAMGASADGLLAVKAARGSQGADIRGLSFSRHRVNLDPTMTMAKEEYSKQLKDTSAIVRPLSAITRGFTVTDLAKEVAGQFNTWGYEEFVRPEASDFAHLADSAGNGPSSSTSASVSIGEAARRRLNMAEGLPPVEYLVWSLPAWAADELWDLTATAILGQAAKADDAKLIDNEASLAAPTGAEREEGVKRSRDSMEEGSLIGATSSMAAAGAHKENVVLVPSSLAQPSPAARPTTSNGSQRAADEELSDAAAIGGDGWDEDEDGWLGATPRHRDWATDDEERSISRRSGGAVSARLGEEAQSLDERSRAATGDAGFTARTKALVSRLKQLLLPSTLSLPAIPESARALFGSQSQPFSNGPPSKRQKTDVATTSPSSTSSDLPGSSAQKGATVCTLSQLLPPPMNPEKALMVRGASQLPAPPLPSPAAAAAAASSAPVAATPTKAADVAGGAGGVGTPGLHAKRRMRAAQTFYDLLVLQNRGFVRLNQPEAYEDLGVQPLAPIATAASTQSAGLPAELVAAAGALF